MGGIAARILCYNSPPSGAQNESDIPSEGREIVLSGGDADKQ
jgi:hypothetical protein